MACDLNAGGLPAGGRGSSAAEGACRRHGGGALYLLLILAGLAATAARAEVPVPPGTVPDLPAVRVETPPVIDGDLSDACWERAARVTDFWASNYNRPAREQTIAWICCDADTLYVAFHCLDPEPDKIRAFQRKRDGGMSNDDRVEVEIDTFHSHREDADFTINALGTQTDDLGTGKTAWKGDWQAAARIVADGWNCEIAIPFAILDYPPGADLFGINFNRYCERLSEFSEYTHPGIATVDARVEDYPHLTGLQLPARKPSRRPMVMIHGLSQIAGGGRPSTFTTGVDLKYHPTTNTTALFTAKPDFSTVEQDVEGIDFTYTERQLSDNRAFFTEGSSYLDGAWLYSRRIPEFDTGVKGYGRVGPYTLGGFGAFRLGERTDAGVQIGREFGNPFSSYVSMVSRMEDGHQNHVGAWRASWHPGDWSLNVNTARSSTTGPGGDGGRVVVSGGYTSRRWSTSLSYQNTSAFFNPEDGYIAYRDLCGISGELYQDARSAAKGVQLWHMHVEGNAYQRHSGAIIDTRLNTHTAVTMRNGDSYRIELQQERHPDPDHPEVVHTDQTVKLAGSWATRDPYRSSGLSIVAGQVRGGPYLLAGPYLGLRLTDGLSVRVSSQYRAMDNADGVQRRIWQHVATLSYEITRERVLGARLVRRPEGVNLSVSYRQAMRKGVDAYVIFGDPNAVKTQTQAYAKVVFIL